MPFATTADQDAALDAIVASLIDPATWRLHASIPADTGTELAAMGGYAPAPYSLADWAASSGGAKPATADFGIATGAYSDVAPYWAIHNSAGAVILWDFIPGESVAVGDGGTVSPVTVSPALYFRNDA